MLLMLHRWPLFSKNAPPRRVWSSLRILAVTATLLAIRCSRPAASPARVAAIDTPASAVDLPTLWTQQVQRRQSAFFRMTLPVVASGMRIDIGLPDTPSTWVGGTTSIALYSSHMLRGSVTGPAVDQLTGYPEAPSDRGSFLVPLPANSQKNASAHFLVQEPMPIYLRLDISALQEPGKYLFPVTLTLPGKKPEKAALEVDVSPVSLPTQPRVLAVATTTANDLARIFPTAFAANNPRFLDRADPENHAAVEQLDTLVKTAQRNGIAFFVEDLGPRIKVDEVGRLLLNWDAYDRLLQPYMDGSAFDDRVPLPVWLAPVPPARISDSPTQLRQYIESCAQHFADKGWTATPAFMHEALASTAPGDAAVRDEVTKMLRLHMVRDMLAVTTPDATVPQPRLWVVDDSDTRLPPAGALATEETVRLWPWVCAARRGSPSEADAPPERGNQDVRGFVWRNALESAAALESGATTGEAPRPLFVALPPQSDPHESVAITPSLRLLWLEEGLNDAAMVSLLEQRGDPAVVQELFAGIVGRTGLTGNSAPLDATAARLHLPLIDPGYLYAGWPDDKATWAAVPSMLEKLVLASAPGAAERMSADDPLYMAATLWLAKSRRPVARVGGYDFQLGTGLDGGTLNWTLALLLENPINSPVDMDAAFALLPGDLDLAPSAASAGNRRRVQVAPYGRSWLTIPLAGHPDTLAPDAGLIPLQITERNLGAALQLPIQLPILHIKKIDGGLKIDGFAKDWPSDLATQSAGQMHVGIHYLSRPGLIKGAVRMDDAPATARWAFDDDYIYLLVHCPQTSVADQRNNDWPIDNHRWWGTDGLQIQIASAGPDPMKRVIELGFKPGGVMMTRVAAVGTSAPLHWIDGPPDGVRGRAVARYGTSIEKIDGRTVGYLVEAALPRTWFDAPPEGALPAWRVNILRHRGSDLASMSWIGPLVNDDDVGMMGLLIAQP
jgi:hypothetical protein